jgi:hypothetical protein
MAHSAITWTGSGRPSSARSPLVQEFQRYAHVARQNRLAATHDDGRHQQMILVDDPGTDRVGATLYWNCRLL